MQTAVAASAIKPIWLVELEFRDTTVRLCNRFRDFEWDSETWLGNGWLRPIGAINESTELRATGCRIELSGADQTMIALVLLEADQSKRGTVWLGALDDDDEIIPDPYQIFSGKLDVPEIQDDIGQSLISLNFESDLISLDRPRELRHTRESQQAIFPGDLGFDYADLLEDWSGFWGRPERPRFKKRKRESKR